MSPTVVALPSLIELRSQYDNSIMRYVKLGKAKGLVRFHGQYVGIPESKFEVHSSESGNGLVHIKSCYNNKYLVVNEDDWITAEAEKPEEDRSKRSCTLLRPTSVDGNPTKIRLFHIHLEKNLCTWPSAEAYYNGVTASYSGPCADSRDVFNVTDWRSLVDFPTVVALPRLIALRSQYDNTILRCIKEEGEVKGFVRFHGEHVKIPEAKFEVHSSENGNGLVHIRSCYNNKYLVVNEEDNWITAKAEKPEEDETKRSCTLLRPTSVDGNPKKIRLTHVYLENNLCLWPTADKTYYGCVLASYSDQDASSRDVCNIIDWQSLVFFPRYVAFIGDNGKYLQAYWHENHEYLQFSEATMENNPRRVGHEIVETSNGNICIRNLHWNKYWWLSPNWIWAVSTNPTSYGTVFEPVKISDNTIALKNVANNLFCTRLTTEGKQDCLNAGSGTINSWAKFKVSELVISRNIENVNFRLMDARIYGESVVMLDSSFNTNYGNATQEQTFYLSYKNSTLSTWSWNVSMKASVETSFHVGVPLIEEAEVKLGFEVAGAYMWGETKDVTVDRSFTYKVSIPPNKKTTVRLMATRGTCDVPFSYTQRSALYTGETVTTQMDDGVYTGVNNYSFYTEVKEESLMKDPNAPPAEFKKVAKMSPSGELTPI